MAKASTSSLDWRTLDTETLPPKIKAQYDAYKDLYKDMKEAREAFEESLRSALASAMPSGKRAVFGYNFGKLSMAVADAEPAKAKASGAISLADLIRK